MRALLPLFLLASAIAAAPSSVTDRQQKIVRYLGKDINVTRADAILAEQAEKVGLSKDEFANGCSAFGDSMTLTPEEEKEANEEGEKIDQKVMQALTFTSRDEILPAFAKYAPKTYEIFNKRFTIIKKKIETLDQPAQTFLTNLGNFLLDTMVKGSQMKNKEELRAYPEKAMEVAMSFGVDIQKLINEYKALPQESKNEIEKAFCIYTSIRIMDEKNQIEKTFAMFQMMQQFQAAMLEQGQQRAKLNAVTEPEYV